MTNVLVPKYISYPPWTRRSTGNLTVKNVKYDCPLPPRPHSLTFNTCIFAYMCMLTALMKTARNPTDAFCYSYINCLWENLLKFFASAFFYFLFLFSFIFFYYLWHLIFIFWCPVKDNKQNQQHIYFILLLLKKKGNTKFLPCPLQLILFFIVAIMKLQYIWRRMGVSQ